MDKPQNIIPFRKSLQAKLLVGVSCVIFVISIFVYVFVPLVAEQKMTHEMINHAKGIGRISASSLSSAVFFEDIDVIQKGIQDIREYDEVRYIGITDTNNTIVYESEPGKFSALSRHLPSAKDTYVFYDTSIVLKKAIKHHHEKIGELIIQVSLQSVQYEIAQFRSTILLFVLAIFIIGNIAVVLLFKPIIHRVKSVVAAAESITNGSLEERAPSKGSDEISHLAIAFNTMVDSVVQSYKEISFTNSNLEKIVEERTSELMNEVAVRKHTEEELIIARDKAEESNRTKSAFLASMSHELRTPLNSIIGFSQILRDDEHITSKNKHYLDMMYRSGAHLLDLINDILDISKIEAGQLELYYEQAFLADIIESVRSIFAVKAEEKELLFIIKTDSFCPMTIMTDARRLRQVLINLVGNAIKFTDNGSVKLIVDVTSMSQEQGTVTLLFRVIDTGRGIETAQIERIFQPFMQQSSRYSEGTGLGLAISSRIIDRMGGTIRVKSELNQGTEFSFEVTFTTNDFTSSQTPLHSKDDSQHLLSQDHNRQQIALIVDDVETNRILLSVILESIGFECHEAENGQQAIECMKSLNPSVIFMDLMMPIMDGKEAVEYIRQTMNDTITPIIAVTADVLSSTKESLVDIGFNDMISKPFTIDQIHAVIFQYLEIPQQSDDNSEESHVTESNEDVVDDTLTHKSITIQSILPILGALPQDQRDAFFSAVELQEFEDVLAILIHNSSSISQIDIILERFRQAVAAYDYKFFSTLHSEYSKLSHGLISLP